jgi:hypothetical protein
VPGQINHSQSSLDLWELNHEHQEDAGSQIRNEIGNSTEQGSLKWELGLGAGLNDETVTKSRIGFSSGQSTQQKQNASSYQGQKGKTPPNPTSKVTNLPQKLGEQSRNGHKRQESGIEQLTHGGAQRTRAGREIRRPFRYRDNI